MPSNERFRPPRPLTVALVAVGGYGQTYVEALLDRADREACRIVGVVDPCPERCARLAELRAMGVPVFPTLDEFYGSHAADLVVISSPIHAHAPQTCEALARGSHVLCEKPLGATIQAADAMSAVRDRAKRFVAIGYQWSFSRAVQALKRDVLAGRFGRPLRLRTLCLWPRDAAYYARNTWAGALDDGQGRWILDSPVNNATAHYLHHMFYVVGPRPDRSARPARLTAELYRANRITNYDTGAVRGWLDNGAEFLFLSTHAVERSHGPEAIFEFEQATVTYPSGGRGWVATLPDGQELVYGDPNRDGDQKLWDALRAAAGEGAIVCGPEAASAHTLCVNGMQESAPVAEFPGDLVAELQDGPRRITYARGLAEALLECFRRQCLPSEMGWSWTVRGREVDMTHYRHFPSGPSLPGVLRRDR